jgi:hypothetical protein
MLSIFQRLMSTPTSETMVCASAVNAFITCLNLLLVDLVKIQTLFQNQKQLLISAFLHLDMTNPTCHRPTMIRISLRQSQKSATDKAMEGRTMAQSCQIGFQKPDGDSQATPLQLRSLAAAAQHLCCSGERTTSKRAKSHE